MAIGEMPLVGLAAIMALTASAWSDRVAATVRATKSDGAEAWFSAPAPAVGSAQQQAESRSSSTSTAQAGTPPPASASDRPAPVPAQPSSANAYRAPTPAEERVAESWIARHGRVLSGATPTAPQLAPIVRRLSGATIIGLGEVTHGTHEDQAFKVALIEALVRAGAIDTVAIEANRSAIAAFDRWVVGGPGELEPLVRSESFFRVARTDEFAGLLRWLRDWNKTARRPVHMVGIDLQDGLRDAEEALGPITVADPAAADRIRARLAPMPTAPAGERPADFMRWSMGASKEQFAASRAAVAEIDAWYEGHAAQRGDAALAAGRDAARGAVQGFAFAAPFNGGDFAKVTPAEFRRRDDLMAENLLALPAGGHRVALWAHQGHVLADVPAVIRQSGYNSLGLRVRDAIGPAYRTLAVTYSRASVLLTTISGEVHAIPVVDDKPADLTNDGPQTAGAEFGRAAPARATALWIDLGEAKREPTLAGWRDGALWKGEAGWAYDPAKWQKGPAEEDATPIGSGFDVLVWFRRMTPSHRWAGEFH